MKNVGDPFVRQAGTGGIVDANKIDIRLHRGQPFGDRLRPFAPPVDDVNSQVSQVEGIKKFTVLGQDWLPGADELTPTMKLKRKPIAEKYASQIEAMYQR